MIVYKNWKIKMDNITLNCDGWFLFGVIPLYIRKFNYFL